MQHSSGRTVPPSRRPPEVVDPAARPPGPARGGLDGFRSAPRIRHPHRPRNVRTDGNPRTRTTRPGDSSESEHFQAVLRVPKRENEPESSPEGFSYREIGERLAWTETKANRAITEGRRRFLGVFANIESGEECARFAPTLLALVQRAAQAEDVIALRPHVRHCAGCRATVRELHASRRHRLALYVPFLAGVAPLRWLGERLSDGPPSRPLLSSVVQRMPGPDFAAGVQLASSGGGRGTAVAALVGICLGGGAGSYCLATGVLPDPTRIVRDVDEPGKKRTKPKVKQASARTAPTPRQPPTTDVASSITRRPPVAAPTATPQPEQPAPRRRAAPSTRSSGSQQEFGFESTTRSSGGAAPPSPPTATTATTTPPPSSSGGSIQSPSPPPTSGGEFLP
jgi:hypothetical protein